MPKDDWDEYDDEMYGSDSDSYENFYFDEKSEDELADWRGEDDPDWNEDEEDYEWGDDINEVMGRNDVVGFYQDEEHAESSGFSMDSWGIEEIESRLKDYFKFFSKEERDFIYLNFLLGKTQVELAEFFNKTQPALCNDSNRIKKEIGIVKKLKNLSEKVLEFLTTDGTGLNYFTRDILLVFFYSMSVTKVAKIMGLNSMLCRSRIEAAIKQLKDLGHDEIYDYFQYILENLNKIKRNVSDELSNQKISKLDYTDGHLSQEFNFDE